MTRLAAIVLLAAVCGGAQESPKTYHQCKYVGGTGNHPHLFDVSEIYQCDEGKIEIAGRREIEIEYGYVYESDMGKPSCAEPHPVSDADYANFKWCPDPGLRDLNRMRMCGDKPHMCWDKKLSTWDPDWQGYSCVTPAHGQTQ